MGVLINYTIHIIKGATIEHSFTFSFTLAYQELACHPPKWTVHLFIMNTDVLDACYFSSLFYVSSKVS